MSEKLIIRIIGNEDVNSLILKEVMNIAEHNNSKIKYYTYKMEGVK